MDDPRRRKLLGDRKLHDAIRKVARMRGVPEHEVDAVLSEVIADAIEDANLPLEDAEQARLYLGGSARFKSIDVARGGKKKQEREAVEEPDEVEHPGASLEDRHLASQLVAEGSARFPTKFGWFLRFALGGESAGKIAADANVSEGYVHHVFTDIRQTLKGVGGVMVLLAILVIGWRFVRMPGGHPVDDRQNLATTASSAQPPPPVPSAAPTPEQRAMALRERAKKDFAAGQFSDCMDDLDKADQLDPAGATQETKALRAKAKKKLDAFDSKDGKPVP
jgi:hypothetical protein